MTKNEIAGIVVDQLIERGYQNPRFREVAVKRLAGAGNKAAVAALVLRSWAHVLTEKQIVTLSEIAEARKVGAKWIVRES